MKRNKKECPKCHKFISLSNFNKHLEACKRNSKDKIKVKSEWLQENGKYKCPYCNKEYPKKGIATHIFGIHKEGKKCKKYRKKYKKYKKGRYAWNKGLTKETDNRVKKNGESLRQSYKKGKIKSWCLGLTKETDKRILKNSKKIRKTIIKKIKNGDWHNSFSKSRTHIYREMKFYGKWELNYAKWLDEQKIKWRQVDEKFPYRYKGRTHYYTPDFYLIDKKIYIEIKGYLTDRDEAKWKYFPKKLRLKKLFGKDLQKLGIIKKYKN